MLPALPLACWPAGSWPGLAPEPLWPGFLPATAWPGFPPPMAWPGFPAALARAPGPRRAPARSLPVPVPEAARIPVGRAGAPIGGPQSWPQAGGAPITPFALFFRAGAPIGGPTGTLFRGVRALSFPAPAIYGGPGAPLAPELVGFAGAPLGGVRAAGAPIGR